MQESEFQIKKAEEWLDLPISVYDTVLKKTERTKGELKKILERMKDPKEEVKKNLQIAAALYKKIEEAENAEEKQNAKKAYQDFKVQWLPAFIVRGIFKAGERNDLGIEKVYPMIILDIDGPDGHDGKSRNTQEIKDILSQDPAVLAVFNSPSQAGVKAIITVKEKLPYTPENHKNTWNQVADHIEKTTGWKADPSGKNGSRTCYVSHDPDIFVRKSEDIIKPLEIMERGIRITLEKGLEEYKRDSAMTIYLKENELNKARRISQEIEVPQKYNEWYGLIVSMKNAGMSLPEIEHWSSKGQKYQKNEVATRWKTMQSRSQEKAMMHLNKKYKENREMKITGEKL